VNSKSNKNGLSPIVIILLLLAILSAALVITVFSPPENPTNNPITEKPNDNPPNASPDSELATPNYPSDNNDEKIKLILEKKNMHFNSGGHVSYGYPSIYLEDSPEIADRINLKLRELVDSKILPIIEQLAIEDTPDTMRNYRFELKKGCGFYSIVVTVDISEGITFARETYGWNFLCDTGDYIQLSTHCTKKETFAKIIDSSIQNIAHYDQIIHDWLKEVVCSPYENNEFSFYFENENLIAVLNKRLKLNSPDRDPILVSVPYEKLAEIFPNTSPNMERND